MSESVRERVLAMLDEADADPHAALQLPFVADHSRRPTIYANEKGMIFWVNRAARELFDRRFDQMTDQPITSIVPERLIPAHEAAFNRRVAEELSDPSPNIRVRDLTLQSYARRHDGIEFPVTIRLSSYRHNGSITFSASVEPRNASEGT